MQKQQVRDASDRNIDLSKQKRQQSEASMDSADAGASEDYSDMMNPIVDDEDEGGSFSQLGLLPANSDVSARGPQSQQRYGKQE